jgi:hypothetical protein
MKMSMEAMALIYLLAASLFNVLMAPGGWRLA